MYVCVLFLQGVVFLCFLVFHAQHQVYNGPFRHSQYNGLKPLFMMVARPILICTVCLYFDRLTFDEILHSLSKETFRTCNFNSITHQVQVLQAIHSMDGLWWSLNRVQAGVCAVYLCVYCFGWCFILWPHVLSESTGQLIVILLRASSCFLSIVGLISIQNVLIVCCRLSSICQTGSMARNNCVDQSLNFFQIVTSYYFTGYSKFCSATQIVSRGASELEIYQPLTRLNNLWGGGSLLNPPCQCN